MKRSLLIKSILEVPWVHCNGLYEMNTCSYGSFIKVVTFMRAFCNLIVKSREKCTKSRTAHSSEALFTVYGYVGGNLGNYNELDDINTCNYCYYISK